MEQRLRVGVDCNELAEVGAREHGNVHRSDELGAAALMRLFERCDALGRPQRFADVLLAGEGKERGRLGREHGAYPSAQRLPPLLKAAFAADSEDVVAPAIERGQARPAIGEHVRAARTQAVAGTLPSGL